MMNKAASFSLPRKRNFLLKENGWGYRDCFFEICDGKKSLKFHAKSYPKIDGKILKNSLIGIQNLFDFKIYEEIKTKAQTKDDYIQVLNKKFINELKYYKIDFSTDFDDRFYRGHDQSCTDIVQSLFSKFDRIPDAVSWPRKHNDVHKIVQLANDYDVAIIPFGGGTNITSAVKCPQDENRMILSLDMTQMRKLLWLDEQSMLACFETGISGKELEEILGSKGLTMGHEPDSIEFSTLGGWIATKSSGMKQQLYGNIENLIVKMKIVTSVGVLETPLTPRCSTGPDIERLFIGSEGSFGVVTEAVVKVHKKPKVSLYGSLLFRDMTLGAKFLQECAQNFCMPSNIRLYCNDSYQIFNILYGSSNQMKIVALKAFLKMKRWNEKCFVMASYIIEGDEENSKKKVKKIKKFASKFRGFDAGKFGVKEAYESSSIFFIYLRDKFFRFGIFGDCIEVSVIWSKVESYIQNIKNEFYSKMKAAKIKGFIFLRISQIYREGVCVYGYYMMPQIEFNVEFCKSISNHLKIIAIQSGASLSHHHGIGARNSEIYIKTTSKLKQNFLRVIKSNVDPKNIFCTNNFGLNLKSKI